MTRWKIPGVDEIPCDLPCSTLPASTPGCAMDLETCARESIPEFQRIAGVLKRLAKARLLVKKHKCRFMVPVVSYLGHSSDSKGIYPLPEGHRRGAYSEKRDRAKVISGLTDVLWEVTS